MAAGPAIWWRVTLRSPALPSPALHCPLDHDAPLAGSTLTLAITGDTARLHADAAQLDQTALTLLAARLELLLNAIADGVGDATLDALPILPDAERAPPAARLERHQG